MRNAAEWGRVDDWPGVAPVSQGSFLRRATLARAQIVRGDGGRPAAGRLQWQWQWRVETKLCVRDERARTRMPARERDKGDQQSDATAPARRRVRREKGICWCWCCYCCPLVVASLMLARRHSWQLALPPGIRGEKRRNSAV
jgi:hypothetical protein